MLGYWSSRDKPNTTIQNMIIDMLLFTPWVLFLFYLLFVCFLSHRFSQVMCIHQVQYIQYIRSHSHVAYDNFISINDIFTNSNICVSVCIIHFVHETESKWVRTSERE